jgi:hypothetical protein
VVWDGRDGWYVSDAAANAVLHVDAAGRIRTVAGVASMVPLGGRSAQGVPTGLARAADGTLYVALFGGAPAEGGPAVVAALRGDLDGDRRSRPTAAALVTAPIGVAPTPQGLAVLDYGGGLGGRDRGRILRVAGPAGPGRVLASGLDRPVGMASSPMAATSSPRPTPAACAWSPRSDPPMASPSSTTPSHLPSSASPTGRPRRGRRVTQVAVRLRVGTEHLLDRGPLRLSREGGWSYRYHGRRQVRRIQEA